ncbi:MAG: anti-sigma factor, partial [Pseudomonadota bacterium]
EQAFISVVELSTDGSVVLISDPSTDMLSVRTAGLVESAESDLELWLIAGDEAPRSIGLLRDTVSDGVVKGQWAELISTSTTLAISVEPKGGSPTGAPTGQIIGNATFQAL